MNVIDIIDLNNSSRNTIQELKLLQDENVCLYVTTC
jgi:hypothetical protein